MFYPDMIALEHGIWQIDTEKNGDGRTREPEYRSHEIILPDDKEIR